MLCIIRGGDINPSGIPEITGSFMTTFHQSGIPIQSGLIVRDDLINKLSPVLDYPLTLLSAPSGCGKTTLALQVAQQSQADVVWVTPSQYEHELHLFLQLLLRNLEQVAPGILYLQNMAQQSFDHSAIEIATYLRDTTQRETLIVIDDWHLLSTQSADNWLQALVNELPINCHLMILSQRVPLLNMIELIATRSLLRISQQELYFTRSEVYMLAKQLRDDELNSDEIESIYETLDGWPAGTILALQPSTDWVDSYSTETSDNSETSSTTMSELLFQSIASNMMNQELPDVQQFLKWTSTGEYFSYEMCDDVFEITDSIGMTSEVIQRNLFISQRAGGYQYHRLFRAFLQNNFQLTEPDNFTSAHRRLAGWYQSHNRPIQALEHYFIAQSYPAAIELAERIALAYFAQGQIEAILSIGEQLEPYRDQTPNLNFVHAQIYLGHKSDLEQALYFAQLALDAYQAQNLPEQFEVMVLVGRIHQLRGELDQSLEIFEEILQQDDLPPTQLGVTKNQLGLTYYRLGNLELALNMLEQALEEIQKTSSVFSLAKVYQELELVHRDMGNISEANECLQKQIHYWRQLNNPEQLSMSLNNLGYRYYEQGQYQQAEDAYQQGLEIVSSMTNARSRYYLLTSLADLYRDRGDLSRAKKTYQDALRLIAQREPYAQTEVMLNLSILYRWQTKYEAALTCANNAMDEASKHHLNGLLVRAQMAQWHIRLRPWSVHDILAEVDEFETQYPHLTSHPPVEYLTLKLHIAILQSSMTQIQNLLRRIEKLNQRGESIQFFIAEVIHDPDMKAFWGKVKAQYPELELARQRRTRVPTPNTTILSIVSDTHSLHFYTLGLERIKKNNAYVKLADFSAERVREFLYYFVFNGSSRREQIENILWDDKDPAARRDNFHQTLSRIRGTLGSQIITYNSETELYQLNPDVQLWCDALQLDALVSEARRLSYRNQHAYQLWYQATQISQGELLPGLERNWITYKRQYFHDLNIKAWTGLAEFYANRQDYRAAVSAYQSIETFAPYHEAAYRARMECYAHLGETASIVSTYRGLEDRLRQDLQVSPSPQSYNLYRQLISHAS